MLCPPVSAGPISGHFCCLLGTTLTKRSIDVTQKSEKTHKICEFFSEFPPHLAILHKCGVYQLSLNHFIARLNERP